MTQLVEENYKFNTCKYRSNSDNGNILQVTACCRSEQEGFVCFLRRIGNLTAEYCSRCNKYESKVEENAEAKG